MKKSSIEINPRLGIVTKKSMDIPKIEDQYNWYSDLIKLNPNFENLIPQIYSYTKSTRSSKIQMEYVAAHTLAKYFTEDQWDYDHWKEVLKTLLKILRHFETYQAVRYDSISSRKAIYLTKTLVAFEFIKKIPFVQQIMKNALVIVNDVALTNLLLLEQKVINVIKNDFLLGKKNSTLSHGNFALNNILYLNNEEYRLIDPLGRCHKQTIYGDINYDLAKLSQSILGKFDYIDRDKFQVSQEGHKWKLKLDIKNKEMHKKIDTSFVRMVTQNFQINLKELSFLEGLTFLDSITRYENDVEKQKALYLMALVKLNQYFSSEPIKIEF